MSEVKIRTFWPYKKAVVNDILKFLNKIGITDTHHIRNSIIGIIYWNIEHNKYAKGIAKKEIK